MDEREQQHTAGRHRPAHRDTDVDGRADGVPVNRRGVGSARQRTGAVRRRRRLTSTSQRQAVGDIDV